MDAKLFSQAIIKFLSGLLIVGLLLFLPAGTAASPDYQTLRLPSAISWQKPPMKKTGKKQPAALRP